MHQTPRRPLSPLASSSILAGTVANQTKAAFRIRRACPDEIDFCSQLVARSFAEELPVTDTGNNESPTPLQLAAMECNRFLTRWIVYAGMVQRLVISSYYSGLEESGTTGQEEAPEGAKGRSSQPLFVAESLHPDGEEESSQIIGVVELAYGECPIPFGAENGDNSDSSKRRGAAPFVCNLAVLPAYRGLGCGKTLFERVLEAAIAGEGSCWGDSGDVREISEIWLQTDFNNTAALRMYKQFGFHCEGIDPDIRRRRQAYLRKRITSDSLPAYGRDLLCINEDKERDDGKPKWSVSYDLDHRKGEHIIGELNFVEENFGTLAPLVAALGTLVGIVLF